jgi:hypothetical protein
MNGWVGHRSVIAEQLGPAWNRNDIWDHPDWPGVQIQRVHHPTAIYPYYVVGIPSLSGRTFPTIKHTTTAIEGEAA